MKHPMRSWISVDARPATGEPTVLTSVIGVAYEGPDLRPQIMTLQISPAAEFDGGAVRCHGFHTKKDIFQAKDYGICGRNIDSVPEWRCLGQ